MFKTITGYTLFTLFVLALVIAYQHADAANHLIMEWKRG